MPDLQSSLITEIETAQIPDVYRRLDEVVGAKHWQHRVRQVKAAIKGDSLLGDFLRAENEIAFGLELAGEILNKYGWLPPMLEGTTAVYPALSFAAQVLSLIELFGPKKGDGFRRRAIDALSNPDAMRGLRLELLVATHLARRGHRIEWPEISGLGRFDLFAPELGSKGLEVECKSISQDKGRAVHAEDALRFRSLVLHELGVVRQNLSVGLSIVLTLPGKLPTRHDERVKLAKAIKLQVNLAKSTREPDGTDIRIGEFDMGLTAGLNATTADAARVVIEKVTGTKNRHGMLFTTKNGGAIVFVVQSMADESVLGGMFKTLGEAAKDQLTGTRAGLLVAGFDGLTSDQLQSIADQDADPLQPNTSLAIRVSDFLRSERRDRVIGVGFLSRSALAPRLDGHVDSGGVAYYFIKPESSMWSEDFRGLLGGASQ
jgi:hypothetical protein